MLGKIEGGEKWMTEEMVGWHHSLNEHEFEQASEDGEGQGSLACCSPWAHKELDTTERLNNRRIGLVLLCAPRSGESVAPGLQRGSPQLRGRQHRRQ